MIKIFSLLFIVFVLTNNIQRGNKKNIVNSEYSENLTCEVTNKAFLAGEKLIYTIYYNWGFVWLPAGEVVFSVQEKDDKFIYSAKGKSFPAYSWIYEVEDYFYSYVDKNSLLPVRAKRNINEGGYRIINDIQFDQIGRKAVSELIINNNDPKKVVKNFDLCMFDILSVIYSLRNVDRYSLKPGDRIPFTMMLDDEIYPLELEYVGDRGYVEVKNLGLYDAVQISPTVIKGRVFAKNERMKIWISNDKNNIPLIIESPLAVGKIKIILQKYDGIRHPFNKK